ncbi:MAG: hypothetical protein KC478_15535 [Bacteriovoracaceae bacterium]|nr:hypothetical protein [Bacteriovoracaceae bacterium]
MKILTISLLTSLFAFAGSNNSTPQALEAAKAHERLDLPQKQQEDDRCMVSTFQGPDKGSKITAVIQEQRDSKNHMAEKELMNKLMEQNQAAGFNFTSRVNCK